ncbi:hypothetical protein BU17DRAFT_69204 [Hysterangium stoloniferum]|nr:hypothetical protein BU17DRAFT_69204 [Hysterangium stoloniferum]
MQYPAMSGRCTHASRVLQGRLRLGHTSSQSFITIFHSTEVDSDSGTWTSTCAFATFNSLAILAIPPEQQGLGYSKFVATQFEIFLIMSWVSTLTLVIHLWFITWNSMSRGPQFLDRHWTPISAYIRFGFALPGGHNDPDYIDGCSAIGRKWSSLGFSNKATGVFAVPHGILRTPSSYSSYSGCIATYSNFGSPAFSRWHVDKPRIQNLWTLSVRRLQNTATYVTILDQWIRQA